MRDVARNTIIMNPPYSLKYDPEPIKTEPRFAAWPTAPRSKADYMFLLDAIDRLTDDGRIAMLFPHGVLFRGGTEGEIRKLLIERNYLDAVIALPENLFSGTGIPTVILIVKKQRPTEDVFICHAEKECIKQGPINVMLPEHTKKIFDAYTHRWAIERFSAVVERETFEKNDWNLNIPRYVDTAPPREPIDMEALTAEMKAIDDEIAATEQELQEMLQDLTASSPEAARRLELWIEALTYEGNADNAPERPPTPAIDRIMQPETGLPTKEYQQLTLDAYMQADKRANAEERKVEALKEIKRDMLDNMFA